MPATAAQQGAADRQAARIGFGLFKIALAPLAAERQSRWAAKPAGPLREASNLAIM